MNEENNQFNIIKSASATKLVASSSTVIEAEPKDESGTFIEKISGDINQNQLSAARADDMGSVASQQKKNDITTGRSSPEMMYYVPIDIRH